METIDSHEAVAPSHWLHPLPLRAIVHYLLALVLVAIYGVQVCPFMESLSPLQLVLPMLAIMSFQFMLRLYLMHRIVNQVGPTEQPGYSFAIDWVLFITAGLMLTVFNSTYYSFPILSGIKVTTGFMTLGFFIAMDLALNREYDLAQQFAREQRSIAPAGSYFPLTVKFSVFATTAILMLFVVLYLVLTKDLQWLMDPAQTLTRKEAQSAVLKELAFICAVLVSYVLNVIYLHMRNVSYFLDSQNRALAQATAGNLDNRIMISTNDEFGVMANYTNIMIQALSDRSDELKRTRDVAILTLASLAETRDNETGAHILRTQRYVRALAMALRDHPRFRDHLNEGIIELIYKSSPLHDIGKVGIPDNILLKPGKLSDEEFAIMKKHTDYGVEALEEAVNTLGETSFLRFAREIIASHHEKWDGSGYPHGLKGEEIPISGRLMAVADVYDALISKRVYKPALPHDKAMQIILEGKGRHFDPDVIDALLAVEIEFRHIAMKYADDAYPVKSATG